MRPLIRPSNSGNLWNRTSSVVSTFAVLASATLSLT